MQPMRRTERLHGWLRDASLERKGASTVCDGNPITQAVTRILGRENRWR